MKSRHRATAAAFAVALLAFGAPLVPAQPPGAAGGAPPPEKDPPPVDQAQVDAAVGRGAEWLRARLKEGLPPINEANDHLHAGQSYNEIVLYTLLHAGVHRGDPDLIRLVGESRAAPPVHTYGAALRAMAFQLYDPVKLRQELLMTAQFLVDNQGQNGMWGYSRPIVWPPLPKVTFTPSSKPPDYTLSGPGAGEAAAPSGAPGAGPSATQAKRAPPKALLKRRAWGEPNDNSNTQYAVLGLRACMAEGIVPPADCLPATERWLTAQQNDDGGWVYAEKNQANQPSYGSMTAGALSSLAVCIRGTKNADPRQDPRVRKGLEWLTGHMAFNKNPECYKWQFYWIYAVERAGALVGTEWFGDRAWYPEGAAWLIESQHPDGAWDGTGNWGRPERRPPQFEKGEKLINTCWAILFLRRATRHIARKTVYTQ